MKDFLNKKVLVTLFFAALAYVVIISFVVGVVFLCKNIILPYFGKEPLPKIIFLIGVVTLNIVIFVVMYFIHSKITIISFSLFSVFISICLVIAGILSFFGVHVNCLEVIFSSISFICGSLMLLWSFLVFMTKCSQCK